MLLAVLLCALCGCASVQRPEPNPDPWEKMNRGIFSFNDTLDEWAIEPAAKVWNFVMPRPVQWGIKNVFDNAWMPAVMGNHLLQAKPREAFLEDLPRFFFNSIYGIGGFFDIASHMDIPDNYTDFGLTMGRWGAPTGPYFVIPLLGPSSVRDGVGRAADFASHPYSYFIPWWSGFVLGGADLFNLRSLYLEEIAQSKAESFDYYLFARDAWIQNRRHRVREARGEADVVAPEDDDLYYFEDDFDGQDDYDGEHEGQGMDEEDAGRAEGS